MYGESGDCVCQYLDPLQLVVRHSLVFWYGHPLFRAATACPLRSAAMSRGSDVKGEGAGLPDQKVKVRRTTSRVRRDTGPSRDRNRRRLDGRGDGTSPCTSLAPPLASRCYA